MIMNICLMNPTQPGKRYKCGYLYLELCLTEKRLVRMETTLKYLLTTAVSHVYNQSKEVFQ